MVQSPQEWTSAVRSGAPTYREMLAGLDVERRIHCTGEQMASGFPKDTEKSAIVSLPTSVRTFTPMAGGWYTRSPRSNYSPRRYNPIPPEGLAYVKTVNPIMDDVGDPMVAQLELKKNTSY